MARGESGELGLKAGDWVEVRTKEEILRTLDGEGRLEGLPFMPQMFQLCGKRLRVFKRAHKTCDTINNSGGRKMHAAVHLEDVRCDGAAYANCDAGCLIFWKEAWLKPADRSAVASPAVPIGSCTEADVMAATKSRDSTPEDPRYSCQATELLKATEPLPWWDARQYLEDYSSNNARPKELLDGLSYVVSRSLVNRVGGRFGIRPQLIQAYDLIQRWRGGVPFPRKTGRIPAGEKTPLVQLGLKPGEKARLRSYDEILDTLDEHNKTRGLFFDAEEVPYCGKTYEVRSRVTQIIDEKTGRVLPIKGGGAVVLKDVVCQGCYSKNRMFCPRAVHPFFREAWLERPVSEKPDAGRGDKPGGASET